MNLGVNPLLQFGLEETRRQLCENIRADLSVVNYVPFDSDTIGNLALDVGDILSFSGGQADFRKYPCIEDSIADHFAYLLGAKNGSKLRYDGLKGCTDAKSQKGADKILDNAKKCADQNPGYKVFDADGKVMYEPKAAEPAVKVPFLVKVSISDLNIRTDPGTDYDRVQFIPIGVYTILEVRSGKGSSAGWGRLKSGIGWISLEYVRRI